MNVVKDSGQRAVVPPFDSEHEELRATVRRWVESEIVPEQGEWEKRREFPRELFDRAGELGFLGLKYPERLGGQGGDGVHDAVWAEEVAAAGMCGGVGAGLELTPGSRRHRSGTSAPTSNTSASCARRSPASDRRARHHRAGGGLRRGLDQDGREEGRRRLGGQRFEDVHHQRRPRRLPGLRGPHDQRGRPRRDLVPDPGARDEGLRGLTQAREDGLALLRHRRALLHRRRGPGRESARRGERGLQADHGQLPVGAAADGARGSRGRCDWCLRRTIAYALERRPSGARSAASRRSATRWPRWRRSSRPGAR